MGRRGPGQALTPWFYGGRSFPLAGFWGRCPGTVVGYDYRYPNTDLERIFPEKYAEKAFLRKNISAPLRLPQSLPWEGAPVRTLGRMRGRSTPPTGGEGKRRGDRPIFLQGKVGYRIALISHSVTASPQGEASGLWSPTRKSVPNQGMYMGTVIAYRPEQCGTTAKTSECQRAGPKLQGRGHPPGDCVRAFSRESLDPPPGTGRETTSQVLTCAGPAGPTYRRQPPRPHARGRTPRSSRTHPSI